MKLLDLRTLPCPQPVIKCRSTLTEENISQLQVIVDNDAAVENVTRYLEQQGFSVQSASQGSDFYITANKGDTQTIENITPLASPELSDSKKVIVFITTETLGRDDDVLGQKLMATFLSTLPEFGSNLWRVILLNGGVKLAATAGDALESLKNIQQSGVNILVCGTCLAHYGLAQAKQVGETSNMLDIITSLDLADKIIRP